MLSGFFSTGPYREKSGSGATANVLDPAAAGECVMLRANMRPDILDGHAATAGGAGNFNQVDAVFASVAARRRAGRDRAIARKGRRRLRLAHGALRRSGLRDAAADAFGLCTAQDGKHRAERLPCHLA